MLSKLGNKHGSSLCSNLALIFLIYCLHIAVNFMQDLMFLSQYPPYLLFQFLCHFCNLCLYKQSALISGLVSGATDEA